MDVLKKYTYDYPRPAVTADIVIVTKEKRRRVLLIRRKHAPFRGKWALPGGFVNENESLVDAARRELHEETGVNTSRLEQLQAFGDPGRDPRGHVVTVAFLAQLAVDRLRPIAADDAAAVGWFPLNDLPPLAFDHSKILAVARKRLRGRVT